MADLECLDVTETVGNAVLCESVTSETVPGLFGMLDDIIRNSVERNTFNSQAQGSGRDLSLGYFADLSAHQGGADR